MWATDYSRSQTMVRKLSHLLHPSLSQRNLSSIPWALESLADWTRDSRWSPPGFLLLSLSDASKQLSCLDPYGLRGCRCNSLRPTRRFVHPTLIRLRAALETQPVSISGQAFCNIIETISEGLSAICLYKLVQTRTAGRSHTSQVPYFLRLDVEAGPGVGRVLRG
jgi:hypothetical protein